MKVNFYLTRNGVLKRKENTVYFAAKDTKFVLPINKIHSIFCYGRITLTSGVVSYLAKQGITIHFFNYYGYYEGSFYPRESLVSGDVVVKQAEHYLDPVKRMNIAREIVRASSWNIRKNLSYYGMDETAGQIMEWEERISKTETPSQLMNVEGNIRGLYYQSFDGILPDKFSFEKRTRQPPENMVNSLISFANSLVYSNTLSEIYNTQLNPSISYLHEPFERRFSLSLDISEIFKPFIGDRVIFKLLNKGMLAEDHFEKDLNCCLLNDEGRKIFLKHFDQRLNTTIKHRALGRKVSYKRLIRLECYKLIKHVTGMDEYSAFRMWW
jgi:CRISPR-associated protein Cas1